VSQEERFSIVAGDVEPAVGADGKAHERLVVLRRAGIGMRVGGGAPRISDAPDGFRALPIIDVGDGDAGASPRVVQRDRATKAGATARYDRHLSFQEHQDSFAAEARR